VEWLAEQMEILHYDYWAEHISKDEKNQRLKQLKEQAKEMEVMGKEMSYAEGYKEGYKRAMDYITMAIKKSKSYNKK
jgi:predicted kinase